MSFCTTPKKRKLKTPSGFFIRALSQKPAGRSFSEEMEALEAQEHGLLELMAEIWYQYQMDEDFRTETAVFENNISITETHSIQKMTITETSSPDPTQED